MSTARRSNHILSIVVAGMLLLMVACDGASPPAANPSTAPHPQAEQDLPITLGGFIHNGPEDQKLDGQCGTNITRDALQCDVHNGLMPWNITELTFQVIRNSDPETEHHYYRERVSIGSLQTETVNIKLGIQLPADTRYTISKGKPIVSSHWNWLIVGAKGTPR